MRCILKFSAKNYIVQSRKKKSVLGSLLIHRVPMYYFSFLIYYFPFIVYKLLLSKEIRNSIIAIRNSKILPNPLFWQSLTQRWENVLWNGKWTGNIQEINNEQVSILPPWINELQSPMSLKKMCLLPKQIMLYLAK